MEGLTGIRRQFILLLDGEALFQEIFVATRTDLRFFLAFHSGLLLPKAFSVRLSVDGNVAIGRLLKLIVEVHEEIFLDLLQLVFNVRFEAANLDHEVVTALRNTAFLAVFVDVPRSLIGQFFMSHTLDDIDEPVRFVKPSLLLVQHLF